MTRHAIRTLIIATDPSVRDGLVTMLSSDARCEVVAALTDTDDYAPGEAESEPETALVSVTGTWVGGLHTISRLREQRPGIKIVVLARHPENAYVHATFAAGADAYVLDSDRRIELIRAFESVIEGKPYLSKGVTHSPPGH